MSNEINTVSTEEELHVEGFGDVEIDAIGEIENITMGAAATAVSNLLDAKVWITTPQVKVVRAKTLSYKDLAPFVYVKIEYILGVSGSSVMILKQSDVQLILNQLMGQPLVVTDDFQFDEMNISAVCEVMNQMMGASATALSELIATPIDISTPVAEVSESSEGKNFFPTDNPDDPVVKISFDLTIDGIIKSEFISVLSLDLAKTIAGKMMNNYNDALNDAMTEPAPAASSSSSSGGGTLSQEEIEALMSGAMSTPSPAPAPSSSGGTLSQEEIEALMSGAMSTPAPAPEPPPFGGMMSQEEIEAEMAKMRGEAPPTPTPAPAPTPTPAPVPQTAPQQPYAQPQGYAQPPMQQMPYGYPQMPYGYPPQQTAPPPMAAANPVKIQNAQLHPFESYSSDTLSHDQSDNLKLLMGVPLDVTVEIGSAKRKVKDILDFSQGTIIELERQAGAPVDIIVNGNLIAKGDVVVIEDNFAVRITEIIKSKFLDSLGGKE